MEEELFLLKQREAELRKELSENTSRQQQISADLLVEEYGIGVGSEVQTFLNGKKVTGVITGFEFTQFNNAYFRYNTKNRNGKLSKNYHIVLNPKILKIL